jgi:hypothetical protein
MKRTVAVLSCLLASIPAFGAPPMAQGTYEIRVQASHDIQDTQDDRMVTIEGGLGYYVVDNVQLGGLITFTKHDEDSYWGVHDVWGLGAFGEMNCARFYPWVPFIGASAQILSSDDDDQDLVTVLTASPGLRFFFTEQVSLALQVNVNWATEDVYDYEVEDFVNGENVGKGESADIYASIGLRFLL